MEPDNDLYRALGRVEGKIDAILGTAERIEQRQDASEKRIETLEANQWRIGAAGASVAAIISFLISYVIDFKASVSKLFS